MADKIKFPSTLLNSSSYIDFWKDEMKMFHAEERDKFLKRITSKKRKKRRARKW